MSKSGDTMITHSQNKTSLFPASPGPSASRFSKSSPFKNLRLSHKQATDGIFVCLKYLLVFWEVHELSQALDCMCFSSLNRPSEISGILTHPKLSLYLSAVSPELSPPHFSSLFSSFQNFELCCEFFLQLSFQFCHGERSQSSQFVGFLVWFQSGLEGSSLSPTFVQDKKAMLGLMALELTVEAFPLPTGVSFSFRQVPAKLANKMLVGKRITLYIKKKSHEKLKKRLQKKPKQPNQVFSFHTGPGSSSDGGRRWGQPSWGAKPEPCCEDTDPHSTARPTWWDGRRWETKAVSPHSLGNVLRQSGWIYRSTRDCTAGVNNKDLSSRPWKPFWWSRTSWKTWDPCDQVGQKCLCQHAGRPGKEVLN